MIPSFLILNGPNMNWLGKREPNLYGTTTYPQLCDKIEVWARDLGVRAVCFQSNSEGVLIDQLQEAEEKFQGVLFNPAGYTHTSIALRDCVAAMSIPVVEVHLTNPHRRELWRQHSHLSEVASATVAGFGVQSYFLALRLLVQETNS